MRTWILLADAGNARLYLTNKGVRDWTLVREFSQRLSATDDLVTEVTRWGLEASGFDLSDDRRPTGTAREPTDA